MGALHLTGHLYSYTLNVCNAILRCWRLPIRIDRNHRAFRPYFEYETVMQETVTILRSAKCGDDLKRLVADAQAAFPQDDASYSRHLHLTYRPSPMLPRIEAHSWIGALGRAIARLIGRRPDHSRENLDTTGTAETEARLISLSPKLANYAAHIDGLQQIRIEAVRRETPKTRGN